MKTYLCNRGLRSRYDIVAFSPPVHTKTMKMIMKTQTKLDLEGEARTRNPWIDKNDKYIMMQIGSI